MFGDHQHVTQPEPAPPAVPSGPAGPRRILTPIEPWKAWLGLGLVVTVTVGATVLLWWAGTAGLNGPELVKARLEALKIGAGVGVGSGGVLALYLAWRRQQSTEADLDNRERTLTHQQQVAADTKTHQERVATDTRADATARRITELFTKASDQLGSDKAPVRLAGLYALQRLAQDHPDDHHLRQTVINVWCAYLRMPYTPPHPTTDPAPKPRRTTGIHRPLRTSTAHRATPTTSRAPTSASPASSHDPHQEREVRIAAQRLLAHHLRPGPDPTTPQDTFWTDIDIDLSDATLIDFDLRDCHINTATFAGTTFTGNTTLSNTQFHGVTGFRRAQFHRMAWFTKAQFHGTAEFYGAQFHYLAWFDRTHFHGMAEFGGAEFRNAAKFSNVQFHGDSDFEGAHFHDRSNFEGAHFRRPAGFEGVQFHNMAGFEGAQFHNAAGFIRSHFQGEAGFKRVQFHGLIEFGGAHFHGMAGFDQVRFYNVAGFIKVQFYGEARFDRAQFHDVARFIDAQFHNAAEFSMAQFHGEARFDEAQFHDGPPVMSGVKSRSLISIWPLGWAGLLIRDEEEDGTQAARAVPVPVVTPQLDNRNKVSSTS
jgi:uncharacterized protein YjbI with pentapeptide repeats